MELIKKFAFAIALCTASFNSANASDWTGFYIGTTAGGASSEAKFRTGPTSRGTYFLDSDVASINSTGAASARKSTGTIGLTLGVNRQTSGFVYGGELDLAYLGANIRRSNQVVYPCCAPSSYALNQNAKLDGLITLRGRAGYSIGKSFFYGTAGAALTTLKTSYSFSDNFGSNAQSLSSHSKTQLGWVAGVGYEYALSNHWSLKAEYLRADFGRVSQSAPLTAVGSSSQLEQTTRVRSDIYRLGINRKF